MRKILLLAFFALCFVSGFGQYKHEWTTTSGSAGYEYWNWSAVDKEASTLLLFQATQDFDLNPDTTIVNNIGLLSPICNVLSKYDSLGNYNWHRRFAFGIVHLNWVSTDVSNNIVVAGYFKGTAVVENGNGGFDTIVSSGGGAHYNIVFLKFSSLGSLNFLKTIQATGCSLENLYIDMHDNIFLCGQFSSGQIDFDPGPGTSIANPTNNTGFFAKYNSSGDLLFYKIFPSVFMTTFYIHDIKTDNSGNIITVGMIDGSANLGNGNVVTCNFFAKYDSLGNYIYHKRITGDLNIFGEIDIDPSNNIIIGNYMHDLDFDIDPGPGVFIAEANGATEALIAKFDSAGNFKWCNVFGGPGGDYCSSIDIDTAGNIYAYGYFYDVITSKPTFGLPQLSTGVLSGFVAKFDPSGYNISLKSLTASVNNQLCGFSPYSLHIVNNDELVLTGAFCGAVDFDLSTGLAPVFSSGGTDFFLTKYLLKDEHFLISGKVYSDLNNDSIFNTGDAPLQNVIVQVTPGNYFASTSADGNYYCYVPQGNYTITIPTPPVHYTVSFPFSDTAVFMPLTSQVDTANHFALRPEPNAQDLKISMTNLGPMRPGFVGAYVTSAANVGTVALPATATFDYDNDLIYYSAAPVADTILPYHLAWNVDTLFPSQSTNLLSEFIVAANLGDTVTTECRIYPDSADLTPTNNKDKLNLIAQGSWDPNYKEVFPQGALLASQADTTLLTYTIHFQNTGTDTAFTVILVDTLSDLLNVSTFVLEAMSHACTYVISGNGIIEFTFRNIFLPDSGTNFIGSCGFVKYSIKPHVGLNNGMTIENTAHIVFDFNVPVITNTTQTPIGVLGVDENNSLHNSFFLFPNPTSSFITLSNFKPAHSYSITIKNILGNTIISQTTKGKERASINVEQLPSGIYFVMAESDAKVETKKFVKQ
ncbi:MAG TPA: T9SS type A sorting domain-containing protein [Bacteroidia bacterium]|nr:T9SS type A sorting domain-containing protein [Bacteroidia bacterium]HNU33818.1 T9SS type A sorting domain-containing protein [Bacteroidia bacterium]